jgi:hypothetical protein
MAIRLGAPVLIAAALLTSSAARAQTIPTINLTPPAPSRWDAGGYVTWLGVNKEPVAASWDEWYAAASFSASGGYYVTRALKAELDLETTTRGRVSGQAEPMALPGLPLPIFASREHYFQTTSATAGVVYQFFENRWFHPFLGVGVAGVREAHHSEVARDLRFSPLDPRTPLNLPLDDVKRIRLRARPIVSGGFKAYTTERAFVRVDVRASPSAERLEHIGVRIGVGIDF